MSEPIRPDPFTPERFSQVVRQANTKTATQEGDFFQRLLREALAHIAHLQGMISKSCELSGGDLIEIGNLRAEVSRLAAEREEALKAVSEHFAAMDAFVNLGPTVAWLLQRDDEHVKQLATLAAENERLRDERDKFEKWYRESVAVISTVYHITGTIEGGSEIESAKRMAAALASAAATIERLKAAIDDVLAKNADYDNALGSGKHSVEMAAAFAFDKSLAALAAARELEGQSDE